MNSQEKISSLEKLRETLAGLRADRRKIVHCHGSYDLLHIGHVRQFKQARELGDVLVVTIASDQQVEDRQNNSPAFSQDMRAETIASLSYVDYVAISDIPEISSLIAYLRPDVFVSNPEARKQATGLVGEKGEGGPCGAGVEIVHADDDDFTSTNTINRYLSTFPVELQEYLRLFRRRYGLADISRTLARMASIRVLVIGDTILDDYNYCEAIGKSSKEPIIALRYLSNDMFAGGVISIANHVANFADKVHLVSVLGSRESYEDFILSALNRNVTPFFLRQPEAATLIKRRFIEGYSLHKLLEVYLMGHSTLAAGIDAEMCQWLEEHLPSYDLVIVADYGHGAISGSMVSALCKHAKYLAVNTQANAGNRGFHTISRYPRADYVCLAEPEIRLEMRDETGDLHPMMNHVAAKLGCRKVVVTRGKKGSIIRNEQGGFVESPAFVYKVVDRVGAGDAFFSATAMAAYLDVPNEILGFVGNAVGALAVEIIGNQRSVDKESLEKQIRSLLE